MTDANAGFSSSLTHVKEVKQFLMEIIEELGKKEHVGVKKKTKWKQNGNQPFLPFLFRFFKTAKSILPKISKFLIFCR